MNTMNTEHTEHAAAQTPTDRSLKFWLRAADRFMSQALAETLVAEGVSRREWRNSPIALKFQSRVIEAVPAEDLATTMRTLEAIAREFGWDEEAPMPRRRGRAHDHGHSHGPGQSHGERGHGPNHGRVARMAQQTFERGFDAGFSRGREI